MKPITVILTTIGVITAIAVPVAIYVNKSKKNATSTKLAHPILSEANKYVGIKEITPNKGFEDKDFEEKMRNAGWRTNDPYCAGFVKMVMLEVTKGDANAFVKKNMTASAKGTYNNLIKKNDFCEKISSPEPGCLVCYDGHIEFCESVNSNGTITSISGNSIFDDGSQGVVRKTRTKGKGLNDKEPLLGYIKFNKLS